MQSHAVCMWLSNLIFLPLNLSPPQFPKNMHDFRSPLFQDAAASMLQWGGLDAPGLV